MNEKKTWDDFRKTGLLLFINSFLHIFGWAITVVLDKEGKVEEVYPARVSYRGFNEEASSAAYVKLSRYMVENAVELEKETLE